MTTVHVSAGASEYVVSTFVNICAKHKSNNLAIAELETREEWRLLKTEKTERGTTFHYWNAANGSNLRPRTGSAVVVLQTSGNNERCSVGVYNITLTSILNSLNRIAEVSELERDVLGYSVPFSIQDQELPVDGNLFTRADRWWFLMLNRTRPK